MAVNALFSVFITFIGYVAGSTYLDLTEGSNCTWQGLDGKCVELHRCLSSLEDIKQKNFPAICSYKDMTPIICCTDCELVEDTRIIVNTSVGFFYKNGQRSRDACLDFLKNYYFPCMYHYGAGMMKDLNKEHKCYHYSPWAVAASGGTDAERDEFPHMALLGYGEDLESAQWLCGGSLISEEYILTAGHCISSPKIGPVKYAALGILKRSDPPELWQRYRVKRIIAHPDYRPPSKYHDIALLQTEKRIKFDKHVVPACLHVRFQLGDEVAAATGWGALGHRRELADTLQTVSLEVFSEEECSNQYPPHRHLSAGYNHTTQMCYGDRKSIQDTCEGDSGGPLQNKNHVSSWCVFTILGVTSYGAACGFVGSAGMYTRVSHYLPWIEDVVWPV